MFCPKCGCQLSDDAAFCGKCGAALNGTAAPNDSKKPKCELVINRPKQLFLVNRAIKIRIDQTQLYSIGNHSTITIPLTAGLHSITFSYSISDTVIDIEIKGRAELSVKYNYITGGINVN